MCTIIVSDMYKVCHWLIVLLIIVSILLYRNDEK